MAPSNPLANWERLGDSFYRKVPIYDAIFDDDVELENYIIAGAPYGGAIGMCNGCNISVFKHADILPALHRDESKPYRFRDAQTAKSSIDIYSCSGKHINRINVSQVSTPRRHVLTFVVGIRHDSRSRLVRQGRTPGDHGRRHCQTLFWPTRRLHLIFPGKCNTPIHMLLC